MEYFLGSIITLIILVVSNIVLKPVVSKTRDMSIKYSQSYIYALMAPLLDYVPRDVEKLNTQSMKYIENSYVRVVIVDSSAYWIKDNALYRADMVAGAVDKSTTTRVDTMTMDKVELEKTLFIVEKLREGFDDNSGARE